MTDFYGDEAKKKKKLRKKFQNGRLKKTDFFKMANSQKKFLKILWIGPMVSRIDWCEGHWCGSIYMVMRLSDISSKTAKNAFLVFLGHFWAYFGQSHDHIGWATSMPFKSINSINPNLIHEIFVKKYWELAELENDILILFLVIFKKHFFINEKTKGFHINRYHLFLRYGWFLQNLWKDFIPTNMQPTVCTISAQA